MEHRAARTRMAGFEREAAQERLARAARHDRGSGPRLRTRLGSWLIRVGEALSPEGDSRAIPIGPMAAETTETRLDPVRRDAVRLRPQR